MTEINLAATIAPKSDQLNADDLVAGRLVTRIVDIEQKDSKEQPIWIHLESHPGRPWKPPLTQRRLLVRLWGDGAGKSYVGRTVELMCDPKVVWGGAQVGGVRIYALSHIEKEEWVAVSESKNKRTQYLVRRIDALPDTKAKQPEPTKPRGDITKALGTIEAWTGDTKALKDGLASSSWTPDEKKQIADAVKALEKRQAEARTVDVGEIP